MLLPPGGGPGPDPDAPTLRLCLKVCSLISKTAFPVSKTSVGPLNFISLEALLAVLSALAQRWAGLWPLGSTGRGRPSYTLRCRIQGSKMHKPRRTTAMDAELG
jgi:hypothetical protein